MRLRLKQKSNQIRITLKIKWAATEKQAELHACLKEKKTLIERKKQLWFTFRFYLT